MPRLPKISPDEATGRTAQLYNAVNRKLGRVPNLMQTMGNSAATLEGYLNLNTAIQTGELSPADRERIALAVAEANQCEYCLAAHSALGKLTGLNADQVTESRRGTAANQRVDALLQFTRNVLKARGKIRDDDLQSFLQAGYTDGQATEVIANIAVNVFTNYLNNVAGTELDFPPAPTLSSDATAA